MKCEVFDNCFRDTLKKSHCKVRSCFAMFFGETKY